METVDSYSQDDLLGGLGLLVEDGLGLSTVTRLLSVVAPLTLREQRSLARLVLGNLVRAAQRWKEAGSGREMTIVSDVFAGYGIMRRYKPPRSPPFLLCAWARSLLTFQEAHQSMRSS